MTTVATKNLDLTQELCEKYGTLIDAASLADLLGRNRISLRTKVIAARNEPEEKHMPWAVALASVSFMTGRKLMFQTSRIAALLEDDKL